MTRIGLWEDFFGHILFPPLAKVVGGGLLSLSSSAENGCSQWTGSELTRVGFLAPTTKKGVLSSRLCHG